MARLLVLCVDRDDDIGKKAKVKGPIIGEDKNIKAATALLMADPGEADGNAIFEAVRIKREHRDAIEVVTLTGYRDRGYRADREILKQLDKVLRLFKNIDGVILITDGADDDELIPIIQSKVKIVSKRTLLVKQAQQLERSYYVIKEVLKDPNFARLIFGLPGMVLLVVAFLQDLGMQIVFLVMGLYLLLKGFGLEDPLLNAMHSFRETTSIQRASFPLYIVSSMILLLSIWAGWSAVDILNDVDRSQIVLTLSAFINGFVSPFMVGVIFFIFGRIGDMHYMNEPQRIKKYLLSLVTVLAIWLLVVQTLMLIYGRISTDAFIAYIMATFAATVFGLAIVRRFYTRRYIVSRLKRGLDVFDQNGNFVGALFDINRKDGRITVKVKGGAASMAFKDIIMVTDYVAVRKG